MNGEMQKSGAHGVAVCVIRLAVLLLGAYLTINLPDETYTALRSKPLYPFPDKPVLGSLLIWVSEIIALTIFYLLSAPLGRLAIKGLEFNAPIPDSIIKGLGGIILLSIAAPIFLSGFHELANVLIFAFNDKTDWNPLSGSTPNLFYKSIEAGMKFAIAYVFVFKKKWLLAISLGNRK